MVKILIVEDDTEINNLLKEAMVAGGYECQQAFSGTEALLYIKNYNFSLIILDLMLPGLPGEEVLKEARKLVSTPIIVLSSKDELDTKVDLLTLGADDYITKPFEIKELLVRVMVQLRKESNQSLPIHNTLKYKDLELDRENYRLLVDGEELALTKHEFKIMELFLLYPQKVFSKNDIYTYAWDEYFIGEDKTINVHISNIRQKLKKVSDKEYIETVWGIGFKLMK